MQLHLTLDMHKVVIGYIVSTSVVLLAILYFMAPAALSLSLPSSPNATIFSNLVLASFLLLLSSADTTVIPARYRLGLRSLATMLMFANIDGAICITHAFVHSAAVPADEKARGALRFSTAMIVLNTILVFLYTYLRKITSDMLSSLVAAPVSILIQRLFRFLTVTLLVVAQMLAWSMTDMCNPPYMAAFPGFTTIGYAIIFLAGCIYNDREAFDYALINITVYVFSAGPIFDSAVVDPNQSAFQGLWQANVWLRFVAGLLVGFSVLAEILGIAGLTISPSNLLNPRGAAQITCMVVGLTGSICVYAKSASGITGEEHNWMSSFAWVVPMLQLLYLITGLDYLRGVVSILAFPIVNSMGTAVYASVTYSVGGGYLNAGAVMCFFAVFTSIVVDIILERPFGIRPIDEYFSDNFPTTAGGTSALPAEGASEVSRKFFTFSAIVIYLAASDFAGTGAAYAIQLLVAFYMFLGNECRVPDLHRIVFFQAVPFVFSTLYWPLSTSTSVPAFLTFFILFWFAFHYIARYPNATLQMVSGERLYESESPFLPKEDPEGAIGSYQRVLSDGPGERTSLITPKNGADAKQISYTNETNGGARVESGDDADGKFVA